MRIIDFADGFTSASAPTAVGIVATSLEVYASSAAYEAANGSAQQGDLFFNSTTEKVNIYENGSWVENASFEP